MFIVNLTYKTELEKIDQFIEAHIEFLNEQYEQIGRASCRERV